MTRRTLLFVDPSPELGGASRVLLDMLSWLDSDRVEGVVVCRSGSAVEERVRSLGHATVGMRFPTLTFAGGPRALARMVREWGRAQREVSGILHAHRPALVHATGTAAVLVAGLPARSARVPLAWHAHELLPRKASLSPAVRIAGLLSDSVICVSEATRKRLVELGGPAGKCRVVHNAVPGSRQAELVGIGPPPPGVPVVLAVGTLTPLKGHHLLVEAAAILIERGLSLRVKIAGGVAFEQDRGYFRALQEDVVRRGLQDIVQFLGYQDDVPGLLRAATVLAHPAPEEEAFGLVPVEAMAAGRAVVASRMGGVAEVVEDGMSGILVAPGSAAALAEAIAKLIGDAALRERMGAAGRRIAQERFGSSAMRSGLESILSPLAKGILFREAEL